MEDRLQSLNNIELLTGITFKTLKKRLGAAGIQPKKNRGKAILYDPREALPALYQSAVSGSVDVDDLSVERARLAKVQREKTEIEKQKMLGNLVDKQKFETEWSAFLVELKDRILALPLKLSSVLAGKDSEEIYVSLDVHLKEILNELAEQTEEDL